jgi:hypothetical protein
MDEVKIGDMPDLMGSGAEFVPAAGADFYDDNGILHFQQLVSDSTHIGYITGGIRSTAPNIFFINTGAESTASAKLYKVFLVRGAATGIHLPENTSADVSLTVSPNPLADEAVIGIILTNHSSVSVRVTDSFGRLLLQVSDRELAAGSQQIPLHLGFLPRGNYVAQVSVDGKTAGSVKLTRK